MTQAKSLRNITGNESHELPDVNMIAWNISYVCNLKCKHCYLETKEIKIMTPGELDRVIRQIIELGVRHVFLAGGEPLLFPGIENVIKKLSQPGISVFINTNGILLDENRIHSLVDSGISGVIIGLDGISPDMYRLIRGNSHFEILMKNIETALKNNLHTECDFTLNALNAKELLELPGFGDKLGLPRITVKRYVPRPQSSFDHKLRLSPGLLKESYHGFLSLYPYPTERENCKIYAHDPLFLAAKAEKGLLLERDILREDCNAGGYKRGWIGISSRGAVQPCPVMTEITVGDIGTGEIKDIINKKQMAIVRDNIPLQCRACTHSSICRGGCRATKIRVGIGLDKPDPCCWIAPDPA